MIEVTVVSTHTVIDNCMIQFCLVLAALPAASLVSKQHLPCMIHSLKTAQVTTTVAPQVESKRVMSAASAERRPASSGRIDRQFEIPARTVGHEHTVDLYMWTVLRPWLHGESSISV